MLLDNIKILDIIIIVISLLLSCLVGLHFHLTGGKQKTLQEYLLANKEGNVIAVSLSTSATFLTGSHLLSGPSESYSFGSGYITTLVGKIIVVFFAAFIYYPVFHKMQLISPFQYLEERFNYDIRLVASFITCICSVSMAGLTLYVPSLALESIINLNTELSIIILSIICAFYSTLGGIKGVIFTDIFQLIIVVLTLFLIITKSIIDENGITSVIKLAKETNRLELFKFDFDPTIRHTFWSSVIGGGFGYLCYMVVNEIQVQRYMTFKYKEQAIKTMFISTIINIIALVLSFYCGLAIYSKYKNCDPVKEGRINKYDEIVPIYILDNLSTVPGFVGLFVSAIMAASLSTVSSILNSTSAMIVEDFVKPIYKNINKSDCPDNKIIIYAKVASFFTGVLSVIFALFLKNIKSLAQYEVFIRFGVVSPMLGVFSLGMFIPFANVKGAFFGFMSGCAFVLYLASNEIKPVIERLPMSIENCTIKNDFNLITLNSTIYNINETIIIKELLENKENNDSFYLFKISFMWYTVIGSITAFFVGLLISFLTNLIFNDSYKDVNPYLFASPIANNIINKKENGRRKKFMNGKLDEDNNDVHKTMLDKQNKCYEMESK